MPSEMFLYSAKRITGGGLSFPSKMPCTSLDLPAKACISGSKLAKIPGTTCSSCYALAGHGAYRLGNAVKGHARRLAALSDPLWVEAMTWLLLFYHAKDRIKVDLGLVGVRRQRKGGSRFQFNETGFHRWHSSGDLQSVDHLAKICAVARATPKIKHWIPTVELGMVKNYQAAGGSVPDNIVIRVSSIMINDTHRRPWPTTSSVFHGTPPSDVYICPAPLQDHRCGPCRACWDREVEHVCYEQH